MTAWKEPVDVATIEALDLESALPALPAMIDGIVLEIGMRVLVKNQLTSAENGHYIVAGSPPALTLIATGESIEAEDIIPVDKGNINAHTAWTLLDKRAHSFVRQDIKHYSLKSIGALKQLWQVLPDATATVAGYYEPGDKGGGDFMFLNVPAHANVISVEPFDIAITEVTYIEGLTTEVADRRFKLRVANHGLGELNNVTRAYLKGLFGLSDDSYYVKVEDSNTLILLGYFSGVSLGENARLQYVKVVTALDHNNANGCRISISGVVPVKPIEPQDEFPLATSIPSINEGCGVINKTTLSIPIPHSGGKYMPGKAALIGDDALMVPATNSDGSSGGLWRRLYAGDYVDVRWFGAVGDWKPETDAPRPTDDLPAFQASLAAMKGFNNRGGKLVADGHFFLGNTLDFYQAVVFEGTGRNESTGGHEWVRSSPGTWLVFPKNVTGFRFHTGNESTGAADGALVRNMTIYCNEYRPFIMEKESESLTIPPALPGQSGHGIWINCPVSIDQVHVENFGEHGFYVDAGIEPSETFANAGGFQFTKCKSAMNGKHGFYIVGLDSTVGLILGCEALMNYGWGFFDDTPAGNTFIACNAGGNQGDPGGYDSDKRNHDYKTRPNGANASCFISCYSEAAINDIYSPASAIGGILAQGSINPDANGFALNGGIANHAPIVYEYKRHGEETPSRIEIGGGPTEIDRVLMIDRAPGTEPSWLTYRPEIDWWSFCNQGLNRQVYLLPTVKSRVRSSGMWFPNGLFLGTGDSDGIQQLHLAAPSPVATQASGEHRTYNRGDIVWNSEPSLYGSIGQVCIAGGTQSVALGVHLVEPVLVSGTTLKLNRADLLATGQFVSIGGGEDVYKIIMANLVDLTITITPGALFEFFTEDTVEFAFPSALPINEGDLQVHLYTLHLRSDVESFISGQYITLGDVADVYKIVKTTLPTIVITPAITPDGLDTEVRFDSNDMVKVNGFDIGVKIYKSVLQGDQMITLNNVNEVIPGDNVTFGDKTNVYKILHVNKAIIDIEAVNEPPGAHAFVPMGKAIKFSSAVFSTFGEVVNIGNSTSYAVNTLLSVTDRYVTITETGKTLILPAAPEDGQTHSIKSRADVTTEVSTEDGLLIDGAPSMIIESLENRDFRYSAAINEWEMR